MRLTVGSLPPAVYWRRRLIVLAAALLLLFLVAQACMSRAPAGDPAAGDEPSSSAGATATGEPATAPGTAPPGTAPPGEDENGDPGEAPDPSICNDDEILVTAVAAQTTVVRGESVRFTIRIAHDADRDCRRDVGGDQRELYLVRGSGAEHVWSSRDCANPSGTDEVELSAGWEREHHIDFSGFGTDRCDGAAAAGPELQPGEYQLRARLGTDRSEQVTITLQ
jgi:hypothetical protein